MELRDTEQSAQAAIRVLVIDEHDELRRVLASRIAQHPDVTAVADTRTIGEGVERLAEIRPDAVLVDPGYGEDFRLEELALLAGKRASLPFVVVLHAVALEYRHQIEAAKLGIRLWLPKGLPSRVLAQHLVDAVRASA